MSKYLIFGATGSIGAKLAEELNQSNKEIHLIGRDKLLLDSIKGSEAISELFEYDLQLFSPDSSLNAKKIIGKSCTAVIKQNDGSSREINGIVSRFYQAGRNKRLCIYGATLRPSLWLLTLSKDCCIFQNKSIPEIIESILKTKIDLNNKNKLAKTDANGSLPKQNIWPALLILVCN